MGKIQITKKDKVQVGITYSETGVIDKMEVHVNDIPVIMYENKKFFVTNYNGPDTYKIRKIGFMIAKRMLSPKDFETAFLLWAEEKIEIVKAKAKKGSKIKFIFNKTDNILRIFGVGNDEIYP